MLTQLTQPIPLHTPKGFAYAHLVIDYGMDHDLQWVTFLHMSGECWTFSNKDVRLVENETVGRGKNEIQSNIPMPATQAEAEILHRIEHRCSGCGGAWDFVSNSCSNSRRIGLGRCNSRVPEPVRFKKG